MHKDIKGLELFSGVELAFSSCLTGVNNMKSKEISVQLKEAVVRLKEQNKSLTDGTKMLRVAKSIIWFILKKNQSSSEVNILKTPGGPQRTTETDDHKILSLLKKKPFHNMETSQE